MNELINFVVIFVSTLLSLAILGLIAGFSPTLYIAQVALATKTSKKAFSYTIALMSGVLVAIILLIVVFQAIHLATLLEYIHSTVQALTVSVILNILVGLALIYGGFHYLRHRELSRTNDEAAKLKKASSFIGLASLGFLRTFLSVGGITATYVAGNVIANVGSGIVEQAIYTIIFLVVTVVPFGIIVFMLHKNSARLSGITKAVYTLLERMNYRLIIGSAAIIFGSSIIIFNAMIALFY